MLTNVNADDAVSRKHRWKKREKKKAGFSRVHFTDNVLSTPFSVFIPREERDVFTEASA